jgi:uncharacterized membrane protein YfcA
VPRQAESRLVLAGVGVVAGFFSALFGVGGGIVVVPLLVLFAAYPPKIATGTSLAAIGLTALFGVASFSVLDQVRWAEAATVGIPAVGGVVLGTWLQQRISSRALVLLFSLSLTAVAIRLFVE